MSTTQITTINTTSIKEKLVSLTKGEVFKMPGLMSPKSIDDLIEVLSGEPCNIGSDWNGVDLDYSGDFQIGEEEIHFWGSAYEGTLLFKKN